MGILGTLASMAGRDPHLEHRLYVDGAMQHQRHQIAEEYKAPEREERRAEAAAREQQRQYEAWEKQRKAELAEAEKAAWRDWASAPRYSGGNAHGEPIMVAHHRSGRVPVAILPPPGSGEPALINGARALVHQRPELAQDERFMEKARVADAAWPDVRSRYGSLLAALRDEQWWASVCAPIATGTPHVAIRTESEHAWAGEYANGREKITTFDLPTVVGIKVAGDGLRIRIAPRVGDNGARWKKATEHIRAAFKSVGAPAGNMSITEDGSGAIVLALRDRDPLEDAVPTTGAWDDEKFRSLLGVDASGQEVWISWRGVSGAVIGGVPGSGKTASFLPLFAGMAGHCEIHIFDGKGQYDWHPLQGIATTYDRTGDLSAPLTLLRELEVLRKSRGDAMYRSLGEPNFWNLSKQQRDKLGIKPIFLVLDECQTWLTKPSSGTDRKTLHADVAELVETLIRKGRSAGIVVVLTTQKPSANSIPTDLRDNASLKVCFRVTTPEQGKTVLGDLSADAPSPTSIPADKPGRAIMEAEGRGVVLLQAGYKSPHQLEDELADATPVENQADVAAGLSSSAAAAAPVLTVVPDAEEPAPEPAADPIAALIPTAEEIAQMSVSERLETLRLIAQLRGGAAPEGAPVVHVPAELVEPPEPEPVKPSRPTRRRTRPAKPAEPADDTPQRFNDTPDF